MRRRLKKLKGHIAQPMQEPGDRNGSGSQLAAHTHSNPSTNLSSSSPTDRAPKTVPMLREDSISPEALWPLHQDTRPGSTSTLGPKVRPHGSTAKPDTLPASRDDPNPRANVSAAPMLTARAGDVIIVRDALASEAYTIADLWDEAFSQYQNVVGVDLNDKSHPIYQRLEGCADYRAVIRILDETANGFELYRHPSPQGVGARIRGALRNIVRVVLSTGVVEAGGEAAALASLPGGKAVFVALGVLLKATKGVSDRFDAVIVLLKKFESYMTRLDMRVGAPLTQASRELNVRILVEMLSALALATNMMRQNRARHFISVLIGKGNDASGVTQRVEDLVEDNTRLTLEEVHHGLHSLSQSLLLTFEHMETAVARLDSRVEELSNEFADMSARFHAAGVYELKRPIMSILMMLEQWDTKYGEHLGPAHAESSNSSALVRRTGETGNDSPWRAKVTVTFLNARLSLESLIDDMLSPFRDLPPADQTALRHMFYSLAAAAVSASVGGDVENIWYAALMSPGAFIAAFLPMAAIYAAAYLCWRHMRSLRSPAISDTPRRSRFNTIILIDVLGLHMLLPIDMFASWDNVHNFLLEQFNQRPGAQYVQSRSYTVRDTAGDTGSSIISPSSWAHTVRAGMTFEMSIVVRQATPEPQCPWCGHSSLHRPKDEWVTCARCSRKYWASSAIERRFPSDSHPVINAVPTSPTLSRTVDPLQTKRHGDSPALDDENKDVSDDMAHFRRITVKQSYLLTSGAILFQSADGPGGLYSEVVPEPARCRLLQALPFSGY